MTLNDAAHSTNRETEALAVDGVAGDELFAVVDMLEERPSLQRALTEPSASAEARSRLAERLFGGHVSQDALSTLTSVVTAAFPDPEDLPDALERRAVKGLLLTALTSGQLDRVASELHEFSRLVEKDRDLADALRNRSVPLENRQALVTRLVGSKVSPVTQQLLVRATAARERTLPRTVATYLDQAAALAYRQTAHVTVAKPLDQERTERLRRALEARTGGPVFLQIDVDPEVLGGMDVRIGENIIESTMAGRLQDARRLLNTSSSKVGRNG